MEGQGRKSPVSPPRLFRPPASRSQGALLFHDEKPDWVYLNPTAREILALSTAQKSPGEIALILSRRHRIAPPQAERDVRLTLSDLTRRGFIGPPSKPLRRTASLQSLQLYITERCNLACRHCHFAASPAASLDLPAPRIISLISEAASLGAQLLVISGGEPLLHPGLKRILRFAAPKMALRLTTNGLLLDDTWARFLAPLRPQIQISLDGPDAPTHDAIRGRGAFAGALAAIRRLQQAGLADNLILATAMQSDNLARLGDIIALAEKLRVPTLRFLPLHRSGRAARNWRRVGSDLTRAAYERFYDQVIAYNNRRPSSGPRLHVTCGLSGYVAHRERKFWPAEGDFWCYIGTTLAVTAAGNAYPCVLMMEEDFLLGNVTRRSLAQIIRSKAMARVCGILADRRKQIPRCAACTWNNFCQAGCMANALDQKGTAMDVDRFCAYRKKLYRTAFGKIIRYAAD